MERARPSLPVRSLTFLPSIASAVVPVLACMASLPSAGARGDSNPAPSPTTGAGIAPGFEHVRSGRPDRPFHWPTSTDLGIRYDSTADGRYLAERGVSRVHRGIDLVSPVGAPLRAPCDGLATSGSAGGFGNYVIVACTVRGTVPGEGPIVLGFLFAHLKSVSVGARYSVARGQPVATTGRSGNASSLAVVPHVHVEVSPYLTVLDALDGTGNLGRVPSPRAGALLAKLLRTTCSEPEGLRVKDGRGWNDLATFDPFLVLTCLGAKKPPLASPPGTPSSLAWSEVYEAATFDVDSGSRP